MPHTRLDRLTYTVYGATETELVKAARARLTGVVSDPEAWRLTIDAEQADLEVGVAPGWQGSVTATRTPTPPPIAKDPT